MLKHNDPLWTWKLSHSHEKFINSTFCSWSPYLRIWKPYVGNTPRTKVWGLMILCGQFYLFTGRLIYVIIFVGISPLKWHIIYYNTPSIKGDMKELLTKHLSSSIAVSMWCLQSNPRVKAMTATGVLCAAQLLEAVCWGIINKFASEATMTVIWVAWSGVLGGFYTD